jgi:hypothetical protein
MEKIINETNNDKKVHLIKEKTILERLRERKEDDFYSVKNDLLNIDSQFEEEMKKYREYQLKRFNLSVYDYFKV